MAKNLMSSFNNEVRKDTSIGSATQYIPMYRTGIDIFDYINAIRREDGTLDLGLPAGRPVMEVGESGTGKTTDIIQKACYIADQFEESTIFHLDYERSTSKERVMMLSGWDSEKFDQKYTLLNRDITAESLYKLVKSIEKFKKDNFDDLAIDTGIKDKFNPKQTIKVLPPTIIVLDSVALMAPEEIEDDDELKGSMGATAIAKTNTNIFKRITGPMENANIILMCVNHLTKKIEIGPVKTKAQVNYLKQDESIPGGKAVVYLTNTLVKLETGSKIEEDKELGIKGFYLNGILIKSRNNTAGISFKMVYNQRYGVDNILTNFVNLKDAKRVTGAGRSFKLESCPDIKFSLKEFKKKYLEHPELQEAVAKEIHELYSQLVGLPMDSKVEFTSVGVIESDLEYDKENDFYYNPKTDKYYEKNSDGEFEEIEVEFE